jgi:chaperonin cofactor prefoldin
MSKDTGVKESIEESIKAAMDAEDKVDSAESTKEAASSDSKDGSRKSTDIPYERFQEVIGEKNELKQTLGQLSQEREQLELALAEQHGLLERIRALKFDDRVSDHVMAIDRALKGEFDDLKEEIEDSTNEELSSEDSLKDMETKLHRQREELEYNLAKNRAETLANIISDKAERYLDALPEEYNDTDRDILAELWNNRFNWDSVEEDSALIDPELARSFEETLVEYGQPRGFMPEKSGTDEDGEETQTKGELLSPEDKVKSLLNFDYSKVSKEGTPVISDDQFSDVMSEVMKRVKGTAI